jgi:hypothetical protein
MDLWFCGLVIAILLVVGGVEMNPGLFSIQGAEIFEFIKKTEVRVSEVRRFIEMIENSLTGMNMVIMVLSRRWTRVTNQ